jgi:DNA-binding Xre family transcriptional regulator
MSVLLLIKHNIDMKTLHELTNIRESTIGDIAKDVNKTFSREDLNTIIKVLGITEIEEIISIVEETDNENTAK